MAAQTPATTQIHVEVASAPVAGATVVVNGITRVTDDAGMVSVSTAAGAIDITLPAPGRWIALLRIERDTAVHETRYSLQVATP